MTTITIFFFSCHLLMCWYRNKNHKTQKPQNKDLLLITTLTQQYLRLYLLLIKQSVSWNFFFSNAFLCISYYVPNTFVHKYTTICLEVLDTSFLITSVHLLSPSTWQAGPPKTSRILRDISLVGQKMPKGSIIHWERARMARGQED